MAAWHRMYKKFLLLVIILSSLSVVHLFYQSRNHIYDYLLSNDSIKQASQTVHPINVAGFFKPSPDELDSDIESPHVVAYNVDSPRPELTRVGFEQMIKTTNTNASIELNSPKNNVYPITLYAPYLIENPSLCSVSNLSILVIVHTAPTHFDRRENIRLTWTNETYFKHIGRVRVLFLLGRVKDETVQKDIEKEFARNGDLLQGDFIDDYHNLTHKGVMAYKWVTERCRNAKLIVKTDDDVTVNMYDMLIKYLPLYENQTKQLFCNHILPGTMPIIRQNTSKWYVDESQFRGKTFYPRYCRGFTVVFTNDVIPALYREAATTPYFWVDDVYLYGLVPGKVPGIKYNGFKEGDVQLSGIDSIKCYENKTEKCNLLIAGSGERHTVETIWMYMRKTYEFRLMENKLRGSYLTKKR